MNSVVNINGFETVIELPEDLVASALRHEGNQDNYHISYGNGLEEVGGTVEVAFTNNTTASVAVELPFTSLLSTQVTALDVASGNKPNAHVEVVEANKIRVYGQVGRAFTGTMKIMWTAKGVI